MQVTGTFPELSAGMKKSAKRPAKKEGGFAAFPMGGRGPRKRAYAPKSFAGRRAASHAKADGCS